MAKTVDCRGLSCPEPVMQARQALQQASEGTVTVIVNNAVARDNVCRAANSLGWQVAVEEDGDDFELSISK